ncbi:hypothetical protein KL86SPO_50210 [uncultured Sporomusa sp.]|uniref:Uncharacterized protein n=1 Tax=uncultured Sporomusa sp. TaxID=307249 RepID=A0A212LYG2_9FIRM|nr:hypothetical protein [uncultured Sporomusa sp.]SCM82439.1 hypothetical protein KL86SPO_50210 [uncultured Sporomusa sp.]
MKTIKKITERKKFPCDVWFSAKPICNEYAIYQSMNGLTIEAVITDESDYDYSTAAASNSKLVQEFASINTDDDILAFVKENGLLGLDEKNSFSESYTAFKNEQKAFKNLYTLYKASKSDKDNGTKTELKNRLQIHLNQEYDSITNPYVSKYIVSLDGEEIKVDGWYSMAEFDPKIIVHWQLLAIDIIARRIMEKIKPLLTLQYRSIEILKQMNANTEIDTKEIPITPYLSCPNLLTLIYLNFYLLLSSKKVPKYCKNCGKEFTPTKDDRTHCPDCKNYQSNWNKRNDYNKTHHGKNQKAKKVQIHA